MSLVISAAADRSALRYPQSWLGRDWKASAPALKQPFPTKARKPLGDGVEGELVLAGSQVAKGYFQDPERTAARFPLIEWESMVSHRRLGVPGTTMGSITI